MLRNPPGKSRVEVEMKMTGQNSFDQRFVCQTIEERKCGVIRSLLAITVITVRLQQFVRRADKVGAFALPVDHHFVVKLVGMERIVKEQDDRIAACNLGFKSFKFLFPEKIVRIVYGDEIHSADDPRSEAQVVRIVLLNQRKGVELVRLILPRLSDIFTEFVVAGSDDAVVLRKKTLSPNQDSGMR